MPHKIARYGWIPDIPDQRDYLYTVPVAVLRKLPTKVDLRPQCPPVYDQGQLGSCTGNAIAAAIQFDQMKQSLSQIFTPSRLFIYYNERVIERTVDSDSGAMIRDGIKSVSKQGACQENMWPYNIGKFRDKPTDNCYTEAAKHTAVQYQRVSRTLNQMKGCLTSSYPFVFGFSVYQSFESDQVTKTGKVPMPNTKKEQLLGGHAVLAVGFIESQKRFIVRNSWGDSWGMKGYFTIPYNYLLNDNLSDDFWTIRLVQ